MIRAYVFGIGKGEKYLERCLLKDVRICGYIDNYKAERMDSYGGVPVIHQESLHEPYDFVIVTLMQYKKIKHLLLEQGIPSEKIICFFDMKDASEEKNWKLIDAFRWRLELLWKHYTEIAIPSMDNMEYELYADEEQIRRQCPRIMDAQTTIDILCREQKSLARFGDNEFELMCGRLRVNYQDVDNMLAERLKEVLQSNEENLLIAIADNYGSLAKYTEEAARDIRMYLTREVRRNHMELLDMDRQYYDAYLSRPYLMYRDKEQAKYRFENLKKLWKGQDVLIVEGAHTRFGVGNNLLEGVKSIRRILVPDKNAFDRYEQIREAASRNGRGKLVLCVIGPTATVLAYDLSKDGYWVVDIGQADTEYEWFLQGTKERCSVKYKTVSEVAHYGDTDVHDTVNEIMESYYGEIIEEIEGSCIQK